MRKLMWFTLGFGAVLAAGFYLGWEIMLGLGILALLLLIFGLWLKPRWEPGKILTILSTGALIGLIFFCVYDAVYLKTARAVDGETMELTAYVTDYSYETDYGSAVEGVIYLEGRRHRVLLYLNGTKQLIPGDTLQGSFRLRMTWGGAEEDTYHSGDGITLLCYPKSDVIVEETQKVPLVYYPKVLRRQLQIVLDRMFPEDTAFFAKALLLGDRSEMGYEVKTAFKVSGISHIVAVSGLHVSILFAVVALLCGKRRMLMVLLGIPLLLLFAAVAGFTPSITRACLMQIVMLLALLCNKEYDPPTSLAFAALVMLMGNPMVITSASFQLSVGCMAGIFLFSRRISDWIVGFRFWSNWKGRSLRTRIRGWFAGGVGVTLSAMFFTTPLVAYYFGAVSLVGVLTNLLTLWAVSLIFYGVLLVCVVYLIWTNAAAAIAWCISWLIRYVLSAAQLLSSFPLAAVYTQSIYVVLWLAFCYCLIAVFLLSRKRQPLILICCGICGLCLSLVLSWMEPMVDGRRMTVLDVGQGQCILIQSEGRTMMIDCGGHGDAATADLAAETLLSQGITRLDALIVTHYDNDHAGGVGYLLSRVPAETVYLPESPDEDGVLDGILPYCRGREHYVQEDLLLEWEGGSLEIFAPLLSSSDNERGLCVLFREEKCDILITGDLSSLGEKLLLREKQIPKLTALVVGHHGSKNSTCDDLLDGTKPQYAFISAGEDNYYGHPHQTVLERLRECGCVVYRTDQNGTIIFRR